jgi:hypothetical protein
MRLNLYWPKLIGRWAEMLVVLPLYATGVVYVWGSPA